MPVGNFRGADVRGTNSQNFGMHGTQHFVDYSAVFIRVFNGRLRNTQ